MEPNWWQKLIQYNQRHSVINHYDRHITPFSDILIYIFICLIYLLILIYLLGDSNTLNVKEILKIYLIEQDIYLNHQDEWYDYHSDLSRYVWLYCITFLAKIHGNHPSSMIMILDITILIIKQNTLWQSDLTVRNIW
jgi:hypothetical protein